jgi:hypothetical protein
MRRILNQAHTDEIGLALKVIFEFSRRKANGEQLMFGMMSAWTM